MHTHFTHKSYRPLVSTGSNKKWFSEGCDWRGNAALMCSAICNYKWLKLIICGWMVNPRHNSLRHLLSEPHLTKWVTKSYLMLLFTPSLLFSPEQLWQQELLDIAVKTQLQQLIQLRNNFFVCYGSLNDLSLSGAIRMLQKEAVLRWNSEMFYLSLMSKLLVSSPEPHHSEND